MAQVHQASVQALKMRNAVEGISPVGAKRILWGVRSRGGARNAFTSGLFL
jgi:hypothetical protein